jgi:hypothetical protein
MTDEQATILRNEAIVTGRTWRVRDGYDRTKHPRMICVRAITLEEVLALKSGQQVRFISTQGGLRTLTINGKIKTWKRNPNRVVVPIKYGMYEAGRWSLEEALAKLVVEVA